MSDVSNGPDWWLGTDGKWYPPVAPASSPTSELGASAPDPVLPSPPATVTAAAGDPKDSRAPSRALILSLAAMLAIVVIGGAIFLVLGGSSSKHAIGGSMTLQEGTLGRKEGDPCTAKSSGYKDIASGSAVVVTDDSGKVLATGSLGAGQLGPIIIQDMRYCVFPISVPNVPDAKFYRTQVSHRGEMTYSFDEMKAKDWTLDLSLG